MAKILMTLFSDVPMRRVMTDENTFTIETLISAAQDIPADAGAEKPTVLVDPLNPDRTVADIAVALAKSGRVFDRGLPVVVTEDKINGGAIADALTPASLQRLTHEVARPKKYAGKGVAEVLVDARLPKEAATMFIESRTEWKLPALHGFSSAPLMSEDGAICAAEGYDSASKLFLDGVPDIGRAVPANPSREQAMSALNMLREHLRTFAFADARMVAIPGFEVKVVDTSLPPVADESAALCALLTAAARPSIDLAPALLIKSPPYSGAGVGKGKLARTLAIIAFGRTPSAVTLGDTIQEFEKRLVSELIRGSQTIFIDNVNGQALRSSLLASALTESPARVRLLGKSKMLPIFSRSFVMVTGNGLTVAEDLVRRFLVVELDAKTETPEARAFPYDASALATQHREPLLVAALTILRWGRQSKLPSGRPAGSFEQWCQWCRDPLLALGCQDPIARQVAIKEVDPEREHRTVIFTEWLATHGDQPVTAHDLHPRIRELISPKAPRQKLAAAVAGMAGSTISGLKLERIPKAGVWSGSKYRVVRIKSDGPDALT
jgi:hypothetical protein